MNVNELREKYNMQPHEENGSYSECHYSYDGAGRAPSGSSYFYTAPGEKTLFHRIDCDEYWSFNAGSIVEVWLIDEKGKLEIRKLGLGEDADPLVFIPKGTVFGSRNTDAGGEGTFFTCITVPRFDYKGFELVDREDVKKLCPESEAFW